MVRREVSLALHRSYKRVGRKSGKCCVVTAIVRGGRCSTVLAPAISVLQLVSVGVMLVALFAVFVGERMDTLANRIHGCRAFGMGAE